MQHYNAVFQFCLSFCFSLFSDPIIPIWRNRLWDFDGPIAFNKAFGGMANAGMFPEAVSAIDSISPPEASASKPKAEAKAEVRKFFPESWLWSNATCV